MGFARLVLLTFTLASCRQLPEINENVCDNGVVEPGEDCDRFSQFEGATRCSRAFCRYECDFYGKQSDPAFCPEGRTCGRDDLCRMPDGSYHQAASSPISFEASQLLIGDVDGDQTADLIGGSPDRIDVRYGAGDGTFPESFSISIDTPRGERTLGDVNGDQVTDILAPYLLGINAFLGDTTRRLLPDAHPQLDFGELLRARMAKDARFLVGQLGGGFIIVAFGLWLDGTNLNVILDGEEDQAMKLPATGGRFLTVAIDDFTEGADTDELVVAIEGESKLVLGRLRCGSGCSIIEMGPEQITLALSTIDLDPFGSLESRGLHLVDFDGDGRKDVFALTESGAGNHAVILRADGTSFEAAREHPLFSGCLPECWPLAVGAKEGEALYVLPDLVVTSTAVDAIPSLAYLNNEAFWTLAEIADFNGDGTLDIAASDGLSPNVAFLYGADGLFNRIDVALRFPPSRLAAGDYDGDGVFDLACVIEGESDEIHVIFGEESGPPTDAIFMARFPNVAHIQSTFFLSPAPWNPDRIHDLVVAVSSDPQSSPDQAAIMVGTGRRRMHAPILLSSEEEGFSPPHLARVGQLTGAVTSTAPDLTALTLDGRLWVLPNEGGARFEPGTSETWSSTFSAGICSFPIEQRPVGCAEVEVGQIRTSDALDEAVLVDRSALCPGRPEPIQLGLISFSDGIRCEPMPDISAAIGDRTALLQTKLADVNGDAFVDLILAFDGAPPTVMVAFGNGDGFAGKAEITLVATPYDVATSGGSQLAILTQAGLFVATFVEKVVKSVKPVAMLSVDPNGRLGVARVNVDGLDDLVFNTGGRVYILEAGEGFAGDQLKE